MKHLTKILALFLVSVFVISCDNQYEDLNLEKNSLLQQEDVEMKKKGEQTVTSVEDVIKLNLDKKFNISEATYNEFLNSLVFENNQFRGAIYDAIELELGDDNSSNSFWNNFEISIRDKDPVIFEGYKPRRGGCKANNRWICVIRDY